MPTPTTPPERYADLTGPMADGDADLVSLIGQLDQLLRPRPAPPQLSAALDQLLQAQLNANAQQHPQHTEPEGTQVTLSRRDVVKAAAASMAWLFTLNHTSPEVAREFARFAQEGPMTGARLAGILRENRSRWNALLVEVGLDRMEEPGVEGTWSVKELVAHMTWYEQRIVEAGQQILDQGAHVPLARNGLAALSMDERNELIAAESRGRPLAEVLAEADQVFAQLMTMLAACPEELLNDPTVLGLPDDIPPWMRVANNSYGHYREHEQAIRDWLSR